MKRCVSVYSTDIISPMMLWAAPPHLIDTSRFTINRKSQWESMKCEQLGVFLFSLYTKWKRSSDEKLQGEQAAVTLWMLQCWWWRRIRRLPRSKSLPEVRQLVSHHKNSPALWCNLWNLLPTCRFSWSQSVMCSFVVSSDWAAERRVSLCMSKNEQQQTVFPAQSRRTTKFR